MTTEDAEKFLLEGGAIADLMALKLTAEAALKGKAEE